MDLYLTAEEQQELETLCDRGDCAWAQLLWNLALPGSSDTHFTVERHDALDWRAESGGVFPRAQGSLKKKLNSFYQKIS